MLYNIFMQNTLIAEIEDALETFARNPQPLFDLDDKLDSTEEMTAADLDALNVCVNFTVGSLAGYLENK